MAEPLPPPEAVDERDPFIDLLRAASLVIVVVFHWAFTLLEFGEDRIRATNPIGDTRFLWLLTWVLQVVPLFFFVGGYVHWRSWQRARDRGVRSWAFMVGRWRRLMMPALAIVGVWGAIGVVAAVVRGPFWAYRAVLLVVSPLWFIAVYAALVALVPATAALHRRFGYLVVAALLAVIVLFDYLRFGRDLHWVGWLNLVVVWSFCHQLGMHYRALIVCRRSTRWALVVGGAGALSLLTSLEQYPRSMVGVPGEISNMAPPTLPMTALVMLQIGIALMAREAVLRRVAASPRWRRANLLANRFSLPLYLLHTTGFVLALIVAHLALSYAVPTEPSPSWWMARPLWVLLPAAVTLPLLVAGRRLLGGDDAGEDDTQVPT